MNPKRILLALISVVSMFYIGCSISGPAHANGTAQQSDDKPKQVKIGGIQWYVDYDAALKVAKEKKKPIWLHFGENPGWAGCRQFASGPLQDKKIVKASKDFVPVFVDTLSDLKTTKRFGENYGSYPVLRMHNLSGKEIGGRIDGNRVAGRIPVDTMVAQFKQAKEKFASMQESK